MICRSGLDLEGDGMSLVLLVSSLGGDLFLPFVQGSREYTSADELGRPGGPSKYLCFLASGGGGGGGWFLSYEL